MISGVERNRVRNDVLSTSAALAEHGQKVVETTDLVLARVLDRTSGMDWASIQSSQDLHDFIAQMRKELPQLESIYLIAPDGHTVANSRTFPLDKLPDVSDRDYYKHALEGHPGTYISAPYRSRFDGRMTFAATRARLREGKFDGLVGATISPDYLHGGLCRRRRLSWPLHRNRWCGRMVRSCSGIPRWTVG